MKAEVNASLTELWDHFGRSDCPIMDPLRRQLKPHGGWNGEGREPPAEIPVENLGGRKAPSRTRSDVSGGSDSLAPR